MSVFAFLQHTKKKKNYFFRVFILDKVTDFLLLLGKLVIVGGVGVASFYVFSGQSKNYF